MEAVSSNNNHSLLIDLPYPPTVNHYWRRVGTRTILSKKGRMYRAEVSERLAVFGLKDDPLVGRICASFTVYPPDRRKRDLDNILKALLDALEHAGVYRDDSQIHELMVSRGEVVRGGCVHALLYSLSLDNE